MALSLLRKNLPQPAVADMFGISQPTALRMQRRILPSMKKFACIPRPGDLAAGRMGLVDGADVPARRIEPVVIANYFGKRRRHSLLIQVPIRHDDTLRALFNLVQGRRHHRWPLPKCSGGTGADNHCCIPASRGADTTIPTKRPPCQDVTQGRPQVDVHISALRLGIERSIAHLKN